MSHLTEYPFKIAIPLPTDADIGAEMATYLREKGQNYKDGRMMLGAGSLGVPIIELARAVFRVDGVDPKLREFICLRICKLLGGVNPWGPNLRMLDNLNASTAEKEGIQNDGPVTGMDEEAQLIIQATEELTLKGAISDPVLEAMRNRYSDEICRKYIAVMCWYNFFNRYLISTRVPAETDEEVIEKVGDKTMPA
ncbi:hypothetical protein AA103196_0203 [Ameyamaea chiangmaiensis NBRC 103196]|uniref:Carboxymuconolactone decarboxylase n=2 Tax=Acetobacteraceae TaxID=433 RepID=A0A850PDI6_9PROT|nr:MULTISPECIES: hypothetical protein [Acetobacteraceae]AQS89088.1 hypothetical protein A0U93_15505 [Neoasaia chiangmaiensis]MBS4076533.1 hypothetical protein [Ameyamaea chiangmaiensis]NVN40002.1 hypothetical protein [Ameyamaea chiangmaiensis]GBQ62053.1 hypothetical protein AA103196_0203 [Ameyamaea chiangmaiensis NBRC 103196]GBR36979.1 hypothetical protein AA101099_0540 [Neoasaia chiangmaiensis NBRC 101099]